MFKSTYFEIFGGAIADCARTPITRPGGIQSPAGLLVLDRKTLHLQLVSANLDSFTLVPVRQGSETVQLDALFGGGFVEKLKTQLAGPRSERWFSWRSGPKDHFFRLYPSPEKLIIEVEPLFDSGGSLSFPTGSVAEQFRTLDLVDQDAFFQGLLTLIGKKAPYERLMIYRFASDWSGQVVSELTANSAKPFDGSWFPPSDIPENVRNQYARNPFRLIGDTSEPTVELVGLVPNSDPFHVDLGDTISRAPAPVHLEYLKRIGALSSFSVGLFVQGRLWGLVIGHSGIGRWISPKARQEILDLAYFASLRISETECQMESSRLAASFEKFNRILRKLDHHPDQACESRAHALFPAMLELLAADGVAYVRANRVVRFYGKVIPDRLSEEIFRSRSLWSEKVFRSRNIWSDFGWLQREGSEVLKVLGVMGSQKGTGLLFFRLSRFDSVSGPFLHGAPTLSGPMGDRPSVHEWIEASKQTVEPWTEDQIQMALTLATLLGWNEERAPEGGNESR